jgi:hypothetical protein
MSNIEIYRRTLTLYVTKPNLTNIMDEQLISNLMAVSKIIVVSVSVPALVVFGFFFELAHFVFIF